MMMIDLISTTLEKEQWSDEYIQGIVVLFGVLLTTKVKVKDLQKDKKAFSNRVKKKIKSLTSFLSPNVITFLVDNLSRLCEWETNLQLSRCSIAASGFRCRTLREMLEEETK